MLNKTVVEYSSEDENWIETIFNLGENFYIDKKGIHFIYDPYEIACYASGTIDIIVPYKVDFSAK